MLTCTPVVDCASEVKPVSRRWPKFVERSGVGGHPSDRGAVATLRSNPQRDLQIVHCGAVHLSDTLKVESRGRRRS